VATTVVDAVTTRRSTKNNLKMDHNNIDNRLAAENKAAQTFPWATTKFYLIDFGESSF